MTRYAPMTVPNPRHVLTHPGTVERIIVGYLGFMAVSLLCIGSMTLLSLLP